ncbi:Uncharacterised protein [Mycobacteroides abscessus subsp. abscessus]|nr:Uncharacterised protein [Mycobacteroides abscessus subsp. abscessus]
MVSIQSLPKYYQKKKQQKSNHSKPKIKPLRWWVTALTMHQHSYKPILVLLLVLAQKSLLKPQMLQF